MALPGVGMGVASAVLALADHVNYGVIDVRVWRVLYGRRRTTFTVKDYQRYLASLRHLSGATGFTAQEVDYLLWRMGERN